MSYRVGVKTKGDENWVFNGLRFAKAADAKAYAEDLFKRWTSVKEFIIEASPDTPNATFPVPSDTYKVTRGPP